MSRDYPTLDEQYGPGAEQADAEAQDDVATELQEAIDSRTEYNHRYWTEVAGRAVEKLHRLEKVINEIKVATTHGNATLQTYAWIKNRCEAALKPTQASGEANE
jgi:hypothetical protein